MKDEINNFWGKDGKIIPNRLYRFLSTKGLGLFYNESDERKNAPIVVEVEDYIVTEVSDSYIIDLVKRHLESCELDTSMKEDILDSLHRNIGLFSAKNFNFLPKLKLNFLEDTKKAAFFVFENGIIQISSDTIELRSFSEINKNIWRSSIIDHKISLTKDDISTSEFVQFLKNLSKGKDKNHSNQRLKSITSAIGYCLHRFKSDSINKAIILMDVYTSGNPNGGTGKTLITKAIEPLRKMVVFSGKSFDAKKTFKFANVNVSTDLILFDDVTRNFDFEALFPLLTTGIEVEAKYKNPVQISFKESPKIIITSNYPILGKGASFTRRKFEFEVSDHYLGTKGPEDEFGHLFFSGWDEDEYNLFYQSMFRCCQYYLKSGLVPSEPLSSGTSKIAFATNEDLVEFAETRITLGVKYLKPELMEKFKRHHPIHNNLSPNKFTRWLKTWAEYKEYGVLETHSGDDNFIQING